MIKFIIIHFLAIPTPSSSGSSSFNLCSLLFYVFQNLPCDAIYLPAITIQLKSGSGQSPIGICVVENLHEYGKHKDDRHSLLDESKILVDFESLIIDNRMILKVWQQAYFYF